MALTALLCVGVEGKSLQGDYYGIPLSPALGTFGVASRIVNTQSPAHLSSLVGGEAGTGRIVSKEFKIEGPTIRLLVRGWDGPKGGKNLNRFELIEAETGAVLKTSNPPLVTAPAKWIEWDVQDLQGKTARIRMVDGNSGGGHAWVAIDRIDAGSSMQVNFNASPKMEGWELESGGRDLEYPSHFGIPYLVGSTPLFRQNGTREIELGLKAESIFLFGLTFTPDIGAPLWHYAPRYYARYFIGDELGRVRINYADGASEEYPHTQIPECLSRDRLAVCFSC